MNEWMILYDDSGAGVDTNSDVLELAMTDPGFVLYTKWNVFHPFSGYRLELPSEYERMEATEVIAEQSDKRQIGTGFGMIRLRRTQEVLLSDKAGIPKSVCLLFHATERRWEYLVIPRNGENIFPEKLQLKENGGKLTFGPFEKTIEYDMEVLRTVSLDRIPVREHYDFQLRLTSATGGDNRLRQVLIRNVALPRAGVYLSKTPELLRQLCYL